MRIQIQVFDDPKFKNFTVEIFKILLSKNTLHIFILRSPRKGRKEAGEASSPQREHPAFPNVKFVFIPESGFDFH
jgi:hypothetical protein